MPTEWLKTIAHGGKSSRAIVGGCVRYCPLDPRLKTRVCARTMYHAELCTEFMIESVTRAGASHLRFENGVDKQEFLEYLESSE